MKQRYYNAVELVDKPFITFQGIGSFTVEEFADSPYADDPLVVSKSNLPIYQYGVCTVKIVDGELVNRTPAEMAVFEAQYNIEISLKSERQKIDTINNSSFTFDGNDFPMDEVSRLYYLAIEKKQPASSELKTMQNIKYQLDAVDINDFMSEFYAKLLLLSKHTL